LTAAAPGGPRPRPSRPRLTAVSVALHAALLALAALVMVPLVWMTTTAFKPLGIQFETLFLPEGSGPLGIGWDRLTLENFRNLFEQARLGVALLNSVFLSSVGAVLATLCCAAGGYALARFEFRGKRVITVAVLGALVIPPPLLLAPTYELLYHLRLLDTYAGLLLPALAPAFGVFLFRQATIQSVPRELLEAARLDGCGELRLFATVALPLLRPMIGAFVLITFLAWWNNFIGPQVVLQSPEKFPLAVAIAQLKGNYYEDYGLQMAATLVSVAPVMILFLLLQKDFIAGLTAGAVKG
jgi:multiple sugar transport system permease protein